MKTILRLAVLACVGTAALALAGNASATQKLSVQQSATALTIKVSQAQTDSQPARIVIYVPSGYTINTSAAPGTRIGTTTGTVFARDVNIQLPLSGDVVVAPPNTNAPGCATGTHMAVWILDLQVAGQRIQLPVHVDATSGAEAALGSHKLVVCLAPDDVPPGTPGRSPNGARLLEATFTTNNIFTVPAGPATWKAITTPWARAVPNPAGTVETRSFVAPGTLTLTPRVNRARRTMSLSGRLMQAGAGVAGAQVTLLIDGAARFRGRTNAAGTYRIPRAGVVLKRRGKVSTSTFQTRATVAERDITSTGCASPSLPGVACVNATASAFTAVSRRVRIRI
jgi:hypothetical protein